MGIEIQPVTSTKATFTASDIAAEADLHLLEPGRDLTYPVAQPGGAPADGGDQQTKRGMTVHGRIRAVAMMTQCPRPPVADMRTRSQSRSIASRADGQRGVPTHSAHSARASGCPGLKPSSSSSRLRAW